MLTPASLLGADEDIVREGDASKLAYRVHLAFCRFTVDSVVEYDRENRMPLGKHRMPAFRKTSNSF